MDFGNLTVAIDQYAAQRGLFDDSKHPRSDDGKFSTTGEQMSLFNQEASGQGLLFNTIPAGSGKKKKGKVSQESLKSITSGLDARAKSYLDSKSTVSPADRSVILQNESLDGQRELFQRLTDAIDRYSMQWDESKHPRDEAGRFAESGSSGFSGPTSGDLQSRGVTAKINEGGKSVTIRGLTNAIDDWWKRNVSSDVAAPTDKELAGLGLRASRKSSDEVVLKGLTEALNQHWAKVTAESSASPVPDDQKPEEVPEQQEDVPDVRMEDGVRVNKDGHPVDESGKLLSGDALRAKKDQQDGQGRLGLDQQIQKTQDEDDPSSTVISSANLKDFPRRSGGTNYRKFSQHFFDQAVTALNEGRNVKVKTKTGEQSDIVGHDNGQLLDRDGKKWGALGLISGDYEVKIGNQPSQVEPSPDSAGPSGNATTAKPEGQGTPKTEVIDATIQEKFKGADGAVNSDQLANHVRSEVARAIQSGKEVNIRTESGRKIPVTGIEQGMIRDKDGLPWGTMGLLYNAFTLEISAKTDSNSLPGTKTTGKDVAPPQSNGPLPATIKEEPQEKLEGAEAPLTKATKSQSGGVIGAAQMHYSDLNVDPTRFQYKVSGIGSDGVTDELKDVKQFNPMLGGQLLVWHDPSDGKSYVVNGHHRHELASRSGEHDGWDGKMSVYFVDAQSPKEARAHGALANIAEGRGTSVDAAKFMRDAEIGVEEMADKHGISLKGKIARDGSALTSLSDSVFQKLSEGQLSEGRALAIANHLPDHDKQNDLVQLIKRQESKTGKELGDAAVSEMARELQVTPVKKSEGGGLFGGMEMPLLAERGHLKAVIRRVLSGDKNVFKQASSSRRQNLLETTGENKLDVAANRDAASDADLRLWDFDKRVNSSGDSLAKAFSNAAEQFSDATTDRKRRAVEKDLESIVRKLLETDSRRA